MCVLTRVVAVVRIEGLSIQMLRYTKVTDRDIICSIPTTSGTLYREKGLQVAGEV